MGLTSNSGWGKQCVVDAKQEEQQHLPGFPHHGNRLTCQFLNCSQNLLAKPDVVQTMLFRPGGKHREFKRRMLGKKLDKEIESKRKCVMRKK